MAVKEKDETAITLKNVNNIGSILANLRIKEGKSQLQHAKKMKKGQSLVSTLERGVKIPSTITVVSYLDNLGYELKICKKK